MVTKKEKTHYNTKAIARVFKGMSQQKKGIVEEMRFGALEHVPEMNVSHKLLRELIGCYDDYCGYLDTLYGRIYITPTKVADALGINYGGDRFSEKIEYRKLNEENKQIIESFKGATLASLTKSVLNMSVEGEENQKKFKRTFVVFVQKCILLPTTISTTSPIHKLPALYVDNIRQWDWATHMLSFLRKGIEARRKEKKQSIDSCVFVLMIIYFHDSKFPQLDAHDTPGPPWVAKWTRSNLLNWIAKEATDTMGLVYRA
ncbi:hypothetical protein Ahy_B01g053586 [Arachis hypogaea]|uniref:Aminotransferase-like plant mobile domain-containing protein n=1 Tax=Arachis hypogaea TaxID=3818 RepID=A0A445AS44_ARAHY|nr:hypothetical protein Ahy_B01g053586 [Arachis hypogaea]